MREQKLPFNHLLSIVRRKDAKAFRAGLGELLVITREWNNRVCRDGEIPWDGSELCATYKELFMASPEVAECKELAGCRSQFTEILRECHTTMLAWQGFVVVEAVRRKWVEVRHEVQISCGPQLPDPRPSLLLWKPGVGFSIKSSLHQFLKVVSEGHKKDGRSLKRILEVVIENNRLKLDGSPTEEDMAKAVLVDIRGLRYVLHHLPVFYSTNIVGVDGLKGVMSHGVEQEKSLLSVEETLSVCAAVSGNCPSGCIGQDELIRLSSNGLYPLDFLCRLGLALRPVDLARDLRTWSRTSLVQEMGVGKGCVGEAIKLCGIFVPQGKKEHELTRVEMIAVVRRIYSSATAKKVRNASLGFALKNQFEIDQKVESSAVASPRKPR